MLKKQGLLLTKIWQEKLWCNFLENHLVDVAVQIVLWQAPVIQLTRNNIKRAESFFSLL